MKKAQEGGVVLGSRKEWSVSYADDVALLVGNVNGFKETQRKYQRYIEKIELELNVEKTKILRCKKAGGTRKNVVFK